MFDWIQIISEWFVTAVLQLPVTDHLGAAVSFFLYDTIKILILLFVITFLMGIVNSYFPIEKVRNFLSRNRLYGGEYLLASTFGAITPFCSCSSVPLFIGFLKGGIPMGVTMSFLITSPLVNEVALAIFLGTFGLKITAIYAVSGILLGVISGMILNRLNLEPLLEAWVRKIWDQAKAEQEMADAEKQTFRQRLPAIYRESLGIVRGVVIYVMIGIAVGAGMHGYVPEGFFETYIGDNTWYAVPLAVILGVPMYANAAGIIPMIQVLVAKGVPIGTALSFMMAVVGLSIPEGVLLKKVMSGRLLAIFFAVVTICIMISGYVFNLLMY